MLYIFDLEDVTDEKVAIQVADRLLMEAIESSNASRRKRQKIRTCESKIKMLSQWCKIKKWDKPIATLRKSLDQLEEARAEMDVSLWGI